LSLGNSMTSPQDPDLDGAFYYGNIDDHSRPLAILVHGFPDTPNTWRYLAPALADAGWRVTAPWLRGYRSAHGAPISAGTYVKDVLTWHKHLAGDERCLLIGHDWGANAAYGAVTMAPAAFSRVVTLAVPPVGALGGGILDYAQVRRSFYIWFIQLAGMAEAAMVSPAFFENLWRDWSPGYNAAVDLAHLRQHLDTDTIGSMIAPYRAAFDPARNDPMAADEAAASLADPPIPTLYLHGANDGALGADALADVESHLPAKGSAFRLVEGAGHFLHLERPSLVNEIVLGWLSDSK